VRVILTVLGFLATPVCAPPCIAQGLRDPFFAQVPFKRWQSEGKRRDIRWDVDVFPVELSVHQRLLTRVRATVELGSDAASPGSYAMLVEFRDAEGAVWQTHLSPPLINGGGPGTFVLFGNAFVLPGDYSLSVAVCNTATLEHSFLRRTVHAKAPGNDPLPLSWKNLPAVEFLPPTVDPPDEWYLPSVQSRLNLPLVTRQKVRVDVLLNATPGGNRAGSTSAVAYNMSVLIPSLKVISYIEPSNGSINVHVLDLARRRVAFEQRSVRTLDWTRLRQFFVESRPGIIDVGALAGFWKMRNFFWDQLSGTRDSDPDAVKVVLVLSGPAFFPNQESLPPAGGTREGSCPMFYIRYRSIQGFARRPRPRTAIHAAPARPAVFPLPEDDLELAVRKLNARIFDVTSPADFRRVLAAVLDQISRL
jgi:hypothetical protein